MSSKCSVVESKISHSLKWLCLKELTWKDENGVLRQWESAERTTRNESGCDAVAIVALVKNALEPQQLCLIVQFRPPLGKYVVELPAGLVDAQESESNAAVRELKEETGYVASNVVSIGPCIANDQGITNANCKIVTVNVDISREENLAPKQSLEASEGSIRVLTVPISNLLERLHEMEREQQYAIDARLYCYALGRHQQATKME